MDSVVIVLLVLLGVIILTKGKPLWSKLKTLWYSPPAPILSLFRLLTSDNFLGFVFVIGSWLLVYLIYKLFTA